MNVASRVERGDHQVPGGEAARVKTSPLRSNGEGDHAQHGGGASNAGSGPSTAELHSAVPLPIPADAGTGRFNNLSPPVPTLSELFAASPRDAGWAGFLLAKLTPDKPLLWVQERMAILEGGRVHPAGLGPLAGQLIHVEARDARAALWAMEEGLRCPALSAVVGELWGDPPALDFTATRRLAVAAERHGVAAWLVRLGGRANLSGARMRWRIASAPSLPHPFDGKAPGEPRWDAELFRARGRPPGRWVVGSDGPADLLPVAAEAADRALGKGQRRLA